MAEIFKKQSFAKIEITEKGRTSLVPVSDITHIKCDGYISILFLKDSPSIAVSKLLKEFENKLSAFEFIRISRSVLINPMFFRYIERKEKRWVVGLENGEKLHVSRRRISVLKHFIWSHFGSRSYE